MTTTGANPGIAPRGTTKDPGRAEAVPRGLERMLHLGSDWEPEGRVEAHLRRRHDAFARCGRDAFYQPFEHRPHGPTFQWGYGPCRAPAHENCAWWHAIYDLSKWEGDFRQHYGGQPLAVVEFRGTGLAPAQLRSLLSLMLKRRPLQCLLGRTMGYLTAGAEGYVWRQLIRFLDLDLLSAAETAWRELAGDEASVVTIPVSPADLLELAAELRCQAEQELPLLVADGSIEPHIGRDLLEAELSVNRIVFGPGFRANSKDEAEESAEISAEEVEEPLAQNSAAIEGDELSEGYGDQQGGEEPVDGREATNWELCRLCGKPDCGQRPAKDLPVLPFWSVERLLESGVLARTGQEQVLVIVRPEAFSRRP